MCRFCYTLAAAFVLIATLAISGSAELATSTEMREVAENWSSEIVARTGAWAGSTNPSIVSQTEIRSDDGRLLARYYNLEPQGYVVVPVLREMPPVKMYSDESNLGPEQEGTVIQLLREVLEARMVAFESLYGDVSAVQPASGGLFDASPKVEWARLAVTSKDFRPETAQGIEAEGGPLLTSNWHQGAPFNNLCPMGDGGRCVVGCVATSASQLMDYWEWPPSGVGSFSYFWDGDDCNGGSVPGQWLSADFSDSYDWANMKDTYDSYTQAEADAVAEFCSEVGIAMEMGYGACGSGTQMYIHAFNDYFRYSSDSWREDRTDHTQASWFALIQQEVDAGRPIWYTINSHAIVADGYRDTYGSLEYHMNYGWGGSHTAWYVLDNLYCYWITGDICPWQQDYMFGNIHPQTEPVLAIDGFRLTEGAGGDGDGHLDGGEYFNLDLRIRNTGNEAANVIATVTGGTSLLNMSTANATFTDPVDWGQQETSATSIDFMVNPDPPSPAVSSLEITLTADGGYSSVHYIELPFGDFPGFADQMESGDGQWTHTNVSGSFTDDWHLETSRAHSGTHSWKHGGAGTADYSNSSDGGLISDPFVVPYNGTMDFYHWIEAEDDVNMTAWDGAIVMISAGDWLGSDWVQIVPEGGYPYTTIDNSASPFFPGTPCYSGATGWSPARFDLSAYAGQLAQVMFRFGADSYVTFEGWYVDDVAINNTPVGLPVAMSPAPGVTVTFDEVSTAGLTWMTVSGDGPAVPSSFHTVPSVSEYCELSTTAEWLGSVEVCFPYDDTDVNGDESGLGLYVYVSGQWMDITTSIDVEANTICGTTPGLSQFIVASTGCCVGLVGNSNGSLHEEPTIGDISIMIDARFIGQTCEARIVCPAEADVNRSASGEATCDDITIGDISLLTDYLFVTGPEAFGPLPNCP